MNHPRTTIFKRKRNMQQITHRPSHHILSLRLNIKYKESTATGTQQFSAQCASSHALIIEFIYTIRGHC